jgi:hypothetical protein
MQNKKSPFSGEGSGADNKDDQIDVTSNNLQAQRQRLLDYLHKIGSATTILSRQKLNIMHPAGRVMELRKAGYPIETHWLNDVTPEGHKHRVANYILVTEAVTSGQS